MLFCPFTSVFQDIDAMRLLGLTESQLIQYEEDGLLVRTGSSEDVILAKRNLISFCDLLQVKLCLELHSYTPYTDEIMDAIEIVLDSLYRYIDRTSANIEIEITANYGSVLSEINEDFFEEIQDVRGYINETVANIPFAEIALKTFRSLCGSVNLEISRHAMTSPASGFVRRITLDHDSGSAPLLWRRAG